MLRDTPAPPSQRPLLYPNSAASEDVCHGHVGVETALVARGRVQQIRSQTAQLPGERHVRRVFVNQVPHEGLIAHAIAGAEVAGLGQLGAVVEVSLPLWVQIELSLRPAASSQDSVVSRAAWRFDGEARGNAEDAQRAAGIDFAAQVKVLIELQ